uniref:Uncharacterized protein n=1 Tax=Romanomermis culicivorax TaxID=13658 RepID=A0A915J504_ROMCU
MNLFTLFKNTTFDNKPCQKWFPRKFRGGYDTTSEYNCRLLADDDEEDVPVCKTGGSNLDPKLTKCYPECGTGVDFYSEKKAWSYSPCSSPITKSCCELPTKSFEETTTTAATTRMTTIATTLPSERKKLRFPMPIELE